MGIDSRVEEQTVPKVNWLDPVFEVIVGAQKYIEFVIQCDVLGTSRNEETGKLLSEFNGQPYPANTSITLLNIPPQNGNKAQNVISARIPSSSMMNPYHDGGGWLNMVSKRLMELGLNPKTVNESMFSRIFSPLFGLKANELSTEMPTTNKKINLSFKSDQISCGTRYSKFFTAKTYPAFLDVAENASQGDNIFEDGFYINVWQMTTASNETLCKSMRHRRGEALNSKYRDMAKSLERINEFDVLSKDKYIVRVSRSIWCIGNIKFDSNYNDRLRKHWKDNSLPESHFGWSERRYTGMSELLRAIPVWDCVDNDGRSVKESCSKMELTVVTNEMATALMCI